MDKNRTRGVGKQIKGSVKVAAGRVMADKSLELEGRVQRAAGKVQSTYGAVKDEVRAAKQESRERKRRRR